MRNQNIEPHFSLVKPGICCIRRAGLRRGPESAGGGLLPKREEGSPGRALQLSASGLVSPVDSQACLDPVLSLCLADGHQL